MLLFVLHTINTYQDRGAALIPEMSCVSCVPDTSREPPEPAMSSTPAAAVPRIEAPDALRGLIMFLMALDHAADFVAGHHATEIWGLPIPQYTSALAFVTRLVSHLAAPGFFLLMGMGMALFAASRRARGWSERRIARHFAVRGLVLAVVDLLLVSPAFLISGVSNSSPDAGPLVPGEGGSLWFGFGVLTALGFSMLLGGVLLRTGAAACTAIGIAVVMACQVLVPGAEAVNEPYPVWLRVLLIPGQTGGFLTIYSVLPWFGVCALGIGAGELLRRDPARCLRWAPAAGVAALLLFGLLRSLGGFGNTHPAAGADWIAILSVTKYPPSIAFLLLTLGVNALLLGLLAYLGRSPDGLGSLAWPLLVLGRAPLFFYVLHLWLYTAVGLAIPGDTSLLVMYPIWIGGVALLLPACVRYDRFKRGRPEDSYWRLF